MSETQHALHGEVTEYRLGGYGLVIGRQDGKTRIAVMDGARKVAVLYLEPYVSKAIEDTLAAIRAETTRLANGGREG